MKGRSIPSSGADIDNPRLNTLLQERNEAIDQFMRSEDIAAPLVSEKAQAFVIPVLLVGLDSSIIGQNVQGWPQVPHRLGYVGRSCWIVKVGQEGAAGFDRRTSASRK